MALLDSLARFLMDCPILSFKIPSELLILIPPRESLAWIIDSEVAVAILKAQPPLAPSQNIPDKLPIIFLIAPLISSLLPLRAQQILELAPIPAAIAQPQIGARLPV